MPGYDFHDRHDRHEDAASDLRATGPERQAQVDRYIGWLFSLAFVIMMLLVAVSAAAARWLWLACAS